jgi:hypothetical protein
MVDDTEDFDDDDEALVCDVCGKEEEEDVVEETWILFLNPARFEILVCDDCADSKDNLEEAFKMFLEQMVVAKMEKH